jgi:hypothetical protein
VPKKQRGLMNSKRRPTFWWHYLTCPEPMAPAVQAAEKILLAFETPELPCH